MLKTLWLIIWLHPVIKCPLCKGQGGAMAGYYEPEWTECECWNDWRDLEDRGRAWFIGRLTPLNWCRAKAAMKFVKIESVIPLLDTLRCATGLHRWSRTEVEPGHELKL